MPAAYQTKSLPIPTVEAPSLDGIVIRIPTAPTVTDQEVAERLAALQRLGAELTPRAKGDPIQPGDEVCVDLIGRLGEKIVPRSFETAVWLNVDNPTPVPEIGRALLGVKVGGRIQVKAKLAISFFEPLMAGREVIYTVDVKAARKVERPDFKSEAFLGGLGAKNLEELRGAIVESIQETHEQHAALTALSAATEVVTERVKLRIPEQVLMQELWAHWRTRGDGKALADRGMKDAELETAFESWSRDRPRVDEFAHQLKKQIVMAALGERYKAELTREVLIAAARRWLPLMGFEASDLDQAVTDPTARTQLSQIIAQVATGELILNRATVERR